jgi:hypothetical protein
MEIALTFEMLWVMREGFYYLFGDVGHEGKVLQFY